MAANIAETNQNMLENIGSSCATSTLKINTSQASASLPSCGGTASMEDFWQIGCVCCSAISVNDDHKAKLSRSKQIVVAMRALTDFYHILEILLLLGYT